MNEPVIIREYRHYTINVHHDLTPESPREWDNLGTMVCFHGRYNLGDKTNLDEDSFTSWDDLEKHLKENEGAAFTLPLYLYDHSGIQIKVGSWDGLLPQGHAYFDSGQVGFIYVSRETLLKEYGGKRITKTLLKKAKNILEGEVETYNDYLTGNVYGYNVTFKGDDIDSCWGYYGSDHEESGLYEAAKDVVDNDLSFDLDDHYELIEKLHKG